MKPYSHTCNRHEVCQVADLLTSFKSWPGYIAMLSAYFDEAGHPSDSKVVSIAAVVSTIRKWHVFDEKWKKILRRYRINNGLHMTDYENRRGDFSHWSKTEPKAIDFIAELAAILKNNIRFACVTSIIMKDFQEVMMERFSDPFEKKRSPFIVLLQTCLEDMDDTTLIPKNQKIACIFEDTRFLAGAAPQHFKDWTKQWGLDGKFASFGFGKKYDYPGLQGADMLAYEGAKHVLNQHVEGGKYPERKLHASLRKSKKIGAGVFDRQCLMNYVQEYSIPDSVSFSDDQMNS